MYPLFEIVGGEMNIQKEYELEVQSNSRVEIMTRSMTLLREWRREIWGN